jgi:uncharacterized protein
MNDFFIWNLRHPAEFDNAMPMSEAEADELFDLFDQTQLSAHAMSAEMADGYLTACVIGPDPPPLHEWMQTILGQPTLPTGKDGAPHHRLLALLRRRHLDIQRGIRIEPSDANIDHIFMPLTHVVPPEDCVRPYRLDAHGKRLGDWIAKDWAEGFRRAIAEDPAWDSLTDDPESVMLLAPLVLFQKGYNPDRPAVQIEDENDLLSFLVLSLYEMRDRWRTHLRRMGRGASAPPEALFVRETPKVGRNEPCPCGSGKKFKKCCGA